MSSGKGANPPRYCIPTDIDIAFQPPPSYRLVQSHVVVALRRWLLLQPFAVPFGPLVVARAEAQLADKGVEVQPPFEVAGLQEDRIVADVGERSAGGIESHQVGILAGIEIRNWLVDRERCRAPGLHCEEQRRRAVEQ